MPEEVSDCIVKTCFPEIRKRIRTTSTSTSGMIAINSSSGFRDTSSTTTAMITTAAGGGIRNTSFEIADEDLQLIRSKYHELISKEEEGNFFFFLRNVVINSHPIRCTFFVDLYLATKELLERAL